jgi:hypothetical protein
LASIREKLRAAGSRDTFALNVDRHVHGCHSSTNAPASQKSLTLKEKRPNIETYDFVTPLFQVEEHFNDSRAIRYG